VKAEAYSLSPRDVLQRVASAIPEQVHKYVIVVGSLAAGFRLLPDAPGAHVRTKDVDCVIAPWVAAYENGATVAEALLAHGWRPRGEGEHARPGTASTPDDDLPAIRLCPPGSEAWFVELLTVPRSSEEKGKRWTRIQLESGAHFGIPSFPFMPLATWNADTTDFGIACARPEMMALANLLEHPSIRPDFIRGSSFEGKEIKRSNKDLGRVLAIAHLTPPGDLDGWHHDWIDGLRGCFREDWTGLARRAGNGLEQLLRSVTDLEEATHTCNVGLLAGYGVTPEQLKATGERLIAFSLDPLEEAGESSSS
jgi:hypothetical protein